MPYKIYSANNPIIQRLNPKPFRLSQPRYCQQDITGFYTIDYTVTAQQDVVNYCPQNTGIYEDVVSGSPTVPSILTTDTALWLDANDASTITLDSGVVSEWRDKSGNNRHATQTNASNRPLLVADGLNSTDVIRFDGSNDFLTGTNLTGDTFSIFAISRFNLLNQPSGDYDYIFNVGQNSPNSNLSMSRWNSDNRFYLYNGSAVFYSTTLTGQTPILINLISKNTSNFLELFINGTTQTIDQPSSISINGNYTLGYFPFASTHYLNGDISQIIIFPRVLTQAERELVEGYLAWSTRLEENLPANHPYKNSYPGITVTPTLVGTIYDFAQAPSI